MWTKRHDSQSRQEDIRDANARFEERLDAEDAAYGLGLVSGLRAVHSRDGYLCAWCEKKIRPGSWVVWVPDEVNRRDHPVVVQEACRRNAYVGYFSAVCVRCAPKAKSRWQRLKEKLFGKT